MPWVRKATAPAYVNVGEAARGLIEGTADSWMTPWLYLLGGKTMNVDDLCARGPIECSPFTEADFLSALLSGNLGGAVVNFLQLGPKLGCFMDQRLFGAYCEFPTGGGGSPSWHTIEVGCWTLDVGLQDGVIFTGDAIPNTSTRLRITFSSGAPGFDLHTSVHAGAPHLEQTGVDTPSPGETGKLTGPAAPLGNSAEQDFTAWRGSYPNVVLWPSIYVGGSHGAEPTPFCGTLEWYGAGPAADPYTPPDVVRPPSAIDPPAGVYPDIAALGAELDNIERKLETLLEQGIREEIAGAWPLVEVDAPVSPGNDNDLELGDARGFVVTISNPGLDVDENFGEPVEFSGLGRVVLGGPSGWLPPIPITVSPLLLVNLPPEVTVCRVHVYAPATFTITRLRLAAPQG